MNFYFVVLSSVLAQLDGFNPDYGTAQISKSDITITLTEGASGARYAGPPQIKAKFCADVDVDVQNGAAFAIYASSSEPRDRQAEKWDELDFEYINTIGPGNVWMNAFHDGVDLQKANPTMLGAMNTGSTQVSGKKYCISWDVTGSKMAYWTVDDRVIKSRSLQGWSKPLKPYISYWGVGKGDSNADPGLLRFLGTRTVSGDLKATAKNVLYTTAFTEPANTGAGTAVLPSSVGAANSAGSQADASSSIGASNSVGSQAVAPSPTAQAPKASTDGQSSSGIVVQSSSALPTATIPANDTTYPNHARGNKILFSIPIAVILSYIF